MADFPLDFGFGDPYDVPMDIPSIPADFGGPPSIWFDPAILKMVDPSATTPAPVETFGGTPGPPPPPRDPLFLNIAKQVVGIGTGLATGAAGVMGTLQGAQQMRALRAAQRGERRVAEPAANLAGAVLPAAQSAILGGPLPSGLEAQVQAWRQAQEMQIKQRLASLGLSDSTMASQWKAWLDQQEQLLRQQLAQGLAQTGQEATVAAAQALGASAAGAGPQAASIAQYLELANQAVQTLEGKQA